MPLAHQTGMILLSIYHPFALHRLMDSSRLAASGAEATASGVTPISASANEAAVVFPMAAILHLVHTELGSLETGLTWRKDSTPLGLKKASQSGEGRLDSQDLSTCE